MANRQPETKKPDTQKADERKDTHVETVWESFPFPAIDEGSWGRDRKRS